MSTQKTTEQVEVELLGPVFVRTEIRKPGDGKGPVYLTKRQLKRLQDRKLAKPATKGAKQ